MANMQKIMEKIEAIGKEMAMYLFAGLSFLMLLILPGILYTRPNTDLPKITDPLPTPTPSLPSATAPNVNPPRANLGFIQYILYLIFFLGLITIVVFIAYTLRKVRFGKIETVPKTVRMKERVKRLKFSRDEAIRILQNSLATGKYREGIIEAFHVLDGQLDHFRKIARPKHWTPKEYAYGVTKPVFKPSIFIIVDIFYKIQYGMTNGTEKDVRDSLDALKHLFIDENDKIRQEKLTKWFEEKMNEVHKWEIIPMKTDLFKPKPRGERRK